MKNLNINLTKEQATLVDRTATRQGFANRSEFVRALLRYVFKAKPEILTQLDTALFELPPIKDAKQIIRGFEATGKYNKQFLRSLEQGLKESDYFNN